MMGLIDYRPEEWCTHEFFKEASEEPTGCWYCGGVDEPLHFSVEWDTPVHKCCIQRQLAEHPDDPEVLIFKNELGVE